MPPIYLHNTLTGKKEIFKPLKDGEVSMYHCGPTVYNYLHIGNLRAYVLADTLRRMFEANQYTIRQIINITDVGHLTANNDEGLGDDGEDKIEKMAKSSGKTAREIADYYTNVFFEDIKALNIKTVGTIFPKASEHIIEQIMMIEELETKGFTYKTNDGIYFDTSKYSEYGKLGHINLKGLEEGHRIGINNEKKNFTDFALWKFSPTGVGSDGKSVEKRFQEWESPWGVGYPGWHIECSAMSAKYLGNTFDIHTGGIDHIPVHHNNEIAQSECVHNGEPLAHYWLHNAFINSRTKDSNDKNSENPTNPGNSGGKMSKSKGDFTRLITLIEKGILPVEYRFWLLQARYSTQVQYTDEAVQASSNGYKNLISYISKILVSKSDKSELSNHTNTENTPESTYYQKILESINDDLDTPKCVALLWDLIKDEHVSNLDKIELIEKVDEFLGLDLILNTELSIKEVSNKSVTTTEIPEKIANLITDREKARQEKNWHLSDKIRDDIRALGYEILDNESGQTLRKI